MAMDKRGSLGKQIALRLSEEDLTRLNALAERTGASSRNWIVRQALRHGLTAAEEDPLVLLGTAAPRSAKRRRG